MSGLAWDGAYRLLIISTLERDVYNLQLISGIWSGLCLHGVSFLFTS